MLFYSMFFIADSIAVVTFNLEFPSVVLPYNGDSLNHEQSIQRSRRMDETGR